MTEETSTPVSVTGAVPKAEGTPTGTIRVTATVDLVFAEGVLTEVGFNAAQLTMFQSGKKLAVRSSFPARGGASITS